MKKAWGVITIIALAATSIFAHESPSGADFVKGAFSDILKNNIPGMMSSAGSDGETAKNTLMRAKNGDTQLPLLDFIFEALGTARDEHGFGDDWNAADHTEVWKSHMEDQLLHMHGYISTLETGVEMSVGEHMNHIHKMTHNIATTRRHFESFLAEAFTALHGSNQAGQHENKASTDEHYEGAEYVPYFEGIMMDVVADRKKNSLETHHNRRHDDAVEAVHKFMRHHWNLHEDVLTSDHVDYSDFDQFQSFVEEEVEVEEVQDITDEIDYLFDHVRRHRTARRHGADGYTTPEGQLVLFQSTASGDDSTDESADDNGAEFPDDSEQEEVKTTSSKVAHILAKLSAPFVGLMKIFQKLYKAVTNLSLFSKAFKDCECRYDANTLFNLFVELGVGFTVTAAPDIRGPFNLDFYVVWTPINVLINPICKRDLWSRFEELMAGSQKEESMKDKANKSLKDEMSELRKAMEQKAESSFNRAMEVVKKTCKLCELNIGFQFKVFITPAGIPMFGGVGLNLAGNLFKSCRECIPQIMLLTPWGMFFKDEKKDRDNFFDGMAESGKKALGEIEDSDEPPLSLALGWDILSLALLPPIGIECGPAYKNCLNMKKNAKVVIDTITKPFLKGAKLVTDKLKQKDPKDLGSDAGKSTLETKLKTEDDKVRILPAACLRAHCMGGFAVALGGGFAFSLYNRCGPPVDAMKCAWHMIRQGFKTKKVDRMTTQYYSTCNADSMAMCRLVVKAKTFKAKIKQLETSGSTSKVANFFSAVWSAVKPDPLTTNKNICKQFTYVPQRMKYDKDKKVSLPEPAKGFLASLKANFFTSAVDVEVKICEEQNCRAKAIAATGVEDCEVKSVNPDLLEKVDSTTKASIDKEKAAMQEVQKEDQNAKSSDENGDTVAAEAQGKMYKAGMGGKVVRTAGYNVAGGCAYQNMRFEDDEHLPELEALISHYLGEYWDDKTMVDLEEDIFEQCSSWLCSTDIPTVDGSNNSTSSDSSTSSGPSVSGGDGGSDDADDGLLLALLDEKIEVLKASESAAAGNSNAPVQDGSSGGASVSAQAKYIPSMDGPRELYENRFQVANYTSWHRIYEDVVSYVETSSKKKKEETCHKVTGMLLCGEVNTRHSAEQTFFASGAAGAAIAAEQLQKDQKISSEVTKAALGDLPKDEQPQVDESQLMCHYKLGLVNALSTLQTWEQKILSKQKANLPVRYQSLKEKLYTLAQEHEDALRQLNITASNLAKGKRNLIKVKQAMKEQLDDTELGRLDADLVGKVLKIEILRGENWGDVNAQTRVEYNKITVKSKVLAASNPKFHQTFMFPYVDGIQAFTVDAYSYSKFTKSKLLGQCTVTVDGNGGDQEHSCVLTQVQKTCSGVFKKKCTTSSTSLGTVEHPGKIYFKYSVAERQKDLDPDQDNDMSAGSH